MNTKKWLALLTALMMLSASMAAFADSPSDMVNNAYENGQLIVTYASAAIGELPLDERTKTIVRDLLDSLTIEIITQKDSDATLSQATVYFGDTPALNAAGLASSNNNDLFFSSSLLGNELIYLTPQDMAGLFLRLMDFALSMDTTTSQADKDATMAYLQNYVEAMLTQPPLMDADAAIDIAFFSSPKAEALLAKLREAMVITPGTYVAEFHDPATSRITLTITKEDIVTALQILLEDVQQNEAAMEYLRMLDSTLPADKQEMASHELITQRIEMLPEQMDEAFHYDNIPVEILLDAAGQVVSIDAIFQSNIAGDSLYSLTYLKQTQPDASIVHIIDGMQSFGLSNDGYGMTLILLEGLDNYEQAEFLYQVFENDVPTSQTALTYAREKNYTDDAAASDTAALTFSVDEGNGAAGLALYVSNEATFDGKYVEKGTWINLYELDSETPLATIFLSTFSEDADELASPAVTEAVRPGAMTEDELNQWFAQVQVQLMSSLQTIMTALPASVQNVLMGQ